MTVRLELAAIAVLSLALLSGCGGGDGGGTTAGGAAGSSASSSTSIAPLAILPGTVTVDATGAAGFSASGGQAPYTFTVTAGGGTVSTAGLYSAPGGAGAATITVSDASGMRAMASVTINPPLTISPGPVAVGVGTTQLFQGHGGTPPYTYAVTAGAGNIAAQSGLYTAPAGTGTAAITVTDSLGMSANAAISINPPLAVVPASITMPASSGQSYSFAGQNGALDYKYRLVSGPGAISPSGLYTAGNSSGTTTIQVTDRQGTAVTATVASVFVRTNGPVYSAVSDGTNWYLGGSFNAVNSFEAPHLAVINTTDGTPNLGCDLQTGFDGNVLATVSDGTSVFVGGKFTQYRGVQTPGGLAKIDPVTCQLLATFFLPTDNAGGTYALFLSGTSLYVNAQAGRYQGAALSARLTYALFKIDTKTGARDASFNVTADVLDQWHIYVTPTALYAGPYKFNPATGVVDSSFSLPYASLVNAYAASGNSLYVGGRLIFGSFGLYKLDAATGAIDPAFALNAAVDGQVYDVALVNGALYAAGGFQHYGGRVRQGLVKVDPATGVLIPSFAPSADFSGNGLLSGGSRVLLAANGSLYVAGNFLVSGSALASRIARVDGDSGAIDTSFTSPAGLNDAAYSLALVGGSLVVGGTFRTYGGTPAANVAKLNAASGIADAAFAAGQKFDGPVSSLLLNGGALFVGGNFQHYGGTAVANLAKISGSTAALDPAFNQQTYVLKSRVDSLSSDGASLFVTASVVQPDGLLYAHLSKLNGVDGGQDPVFAPRFLGGGPTQSALNGQYLYVTSYVTINGGGPTAAVARIQAQTGITDTAFPPIFPSPVVPFISTAFGGSAGYSSMGGWYGGRQNPSSVLKFDGPTGIIDTTFFASQRDTWSSVRDLLPMGSSLYTVSEPLPVGPTGSDTVLARLNPITGAADPAFTWPTTTVDAQIRFIRSSGSDLWVGGDFHQYRGTRSYFFIPIDPATGAPKDP